MSVRAACQLKLQVMAWVVLLLAVPVVRAQSVAAPAQAASVPVTLPEYDVVSIKPNKGDSQNMSWTFPHATFSATNVTLKMMIAGAWHLKNDQFVGLPKWADSAHFDIKAKVTDPDPKVLAAMKPAQFNLMEQRIFTDRFQLKYHYEKRILPVYYLVVAKGGPKFNEATPEEAGTRQSNGAPAGGFLVQNNTITANVVPLSTLADVLSGQMKRIVVDKTDLAGKYDFKLKWTPDDAGPATADADTPPDIFTALQEQLGLKLEPGKAEEQVFVIDHVEMPAAD